MNGEVIGMDQIMVKYTETFEGRRTIVTWTRADGLTRGSSFSGMLSNLEIQGKLNTTRLRWAQMIRNGEGWE